MRVLIAGCGYVGSALGAELVRQGHEVVGLRRSPVPPLPPETPGIRWLSADVTQPESLRTIPAGFDWVVSALAPGAGGVDNYRQVYLEGSRHLLDWLASAPPKKFVYTSSTSVYGQTDGSVVKETSPTTPAADTAKLLVETEELILRMAEEKKVPAVILRVAGIYGPDRCHLMDRFIKNETRLSPEGRRVINMIHRDDLVTVLSAVLKSARAAGIYNAVDDEPVTELHLYQWLSETLGKWMPPFATAQEQAVRTRGHTHKRVSNRRLKMEIGCPFKYPTFRQGYTAEIQRLENAGILDIQPESRENITAD